MGKKYNVLAVGCHPDDIELGCGGTLVKHIDRGDNVYALILTNGEKGKHHPHLQECLASLKLLGVKDFFLGNFRDGYVRDNHMVVDYIESIINKLDIHRVYTHFPNDTHQDHRNCSLAVSAAARKIPEILLFQGPSTHPKFEPHYFIEISKPQLDKKIESLKCYKSQIKKGIINVHWVKNLAGMHGGYCHARYAEAFALNHVFQEGKNV